MKKNFLLNFIAISFLIIINVPLQGSEQDELFKSSPKFLVHIGFSKGLPEDGVMTTSDHDPCLYFSVNGPFPPTKLMSKLDDCSNVIILPLTDGLLRKCVSFHPTEVLLMGSLNLIEENATIVTFKKNKIPARYSSEKIIRYENKNIPDRNDAVMRYIASTGGYPSVIHLDAQQSWGNFSPTLTTINERNFDINNRDLYENVQRLNIAYTCPAGSYNNFSGKLDKIGYLSDLKFHISRKDKNNIAIVSEALINWVDTLDYIDNVLKNEFKMQIVKMAKSKSVGKRFFSLFS